MADSQGREPKLNNDIFFLCALTQQISRMTNNRNIDIVNAIGTDKLTHILNLADVYHSEALESTANDLIDEYGIKNGKFDNVTNCKYKVPSCTEIARVYMRLIMSAIHEQGFSPIAAIYAVYSSPICEKIDDYNSSMYFENPEYLFESYKAGEALME